MTFSASYTKLVKISLAPSHFLYAYITGTGSFMVLVCNKFADSADELQSLLEILQNYCQRWRLTVNTSKTKIVIFRKGEGCQEIWILLLMGKTLKSLSNSRI